jgi:hypothetical protein
MIMYRSNIANIKRAKIIKASLGVMVAARYLQLRGWSNEAIEYIMEQ